ncbi:MAG: glycogen-binding domain-containing protein [Gemmatimonadaceae bacterium]|nr:glycogen-binding domain-containing protein [Gemmatimonadaceae bacterium]
MRVHRTALLTIIGLLPFRFAASQQGLHEVGARAFVTRAAGMTTNGNGLECLANSMVSTAAQTPNLSFSIHSAPIAQATQFGTNTPVVSLGARSPDRHPWRVAASGTVGHATQDCIMLSEMTRAYARLSRTVGRGEVALAYGYRGLSNLDPSRDMQGLGVIVQQQFRSVQVAFDMRSSGRNWAITRKVAVPRMVPGPPQGVDTATWRLDTTYQRVTSHAIRHTLDFRTHVQFAVGRLHFALSGGGTTGRQVLGDSGSPSDSTISEIAQRRGSLRRTQLWSRLDAHVPIVNGVTVVAGVAALPRQPTLDANVRGVYSLGVSLARWPSRPKEHAHATEVSPVFVAVRDDSTQVRFRMRLPKASAVRVSGEPTHWAPVSMLRGVDGWWETALTVAPGTYRINVSIDGAAWSPPPGVPVARDEFGGQVGLVTVR